VQADSDTLASNMLLLLVTIAISSALISLALALFVARMISKPIVKLVNIADNVANGNLNVSIDTLSKDEIGILSRSFEHVVNVVNTFVKDLNGIGHAFKIEGDTTVRVNVSQFSGTYAEVANTINDILEYHVVSKDEILTCISGIVDGDFDAPLRQFPGRESRINESVGRLRANVRRMEQLMVQKAEAEAASQTKSRFIAHMSHEIRTPMNSIMGFSELALDGEISPKTRDYLTKILENSQWLLHIINDILDISKIESGKMELEHVPFDLHRLFAACRTMVMPKAIDKGLLIHFYAEPSIGKMPLGDPTRLLQVLVNLLSNAVKFTSTGMVKLISSVKDMSETSATMSFEISDTGIGMTPEQMQKIFTPFVQAQSGTTRKYGGTGLGLAIVKNIVEMMGGQLSAESMPGVGSKFSFELTFDTVDMNEGGRFEKNITHSGMEKPTFQGEVLLCEDNAMNQQVISEHFARVGLKTVVAENGKTGVDMVQSRMQRGEKQFDLIFMDIHMPVMDGLEAAARILEFNIGIPVVAMTANVMASDRERYRTSGMSDYVGKPFTSQELWSCLLKYFTPVSWQPVSGIQHMLAENTLRQKLIDYFVKNNQARLSKISEAISTGDIKLAHRLAHTLKSNAGQLGKILLQRAAENVEQQLKDGENLVTPGQMAALEKELNAVLSNLAPLVSDHPQPVAETPAVPLDAKAALKFIEKVEPLLEDSDPECLNFIDGLRMMPGSEELIHQMENLDFEQALATLINIKLKIRM